MTVLIIISVTLTIVLIWLGIRSKRTSKLIELQNRRIEELEQIQKTTVVRLQELQVEKQQVFSIVSHDLKGPFNRIFALIQLLQRSSNNLQPDQQEYLAKIHLMIADGLAMMRNLTDNRKLEANEIDLNAETFNFSSLLALLVRNYKVLAEKKKIHMHADILPNMMVHADKFYAPRILDNLLSNALKFSHEGSNIYIKINDDGGWINIAVHDEGPGISNEDQLNLFKKFQPLTARPTGGETATGLGLAVAKTLADKMDAEISCVSNLDEGTVFTLKIRKAEHVD